MYHFKMTVSMPFYCTYARLKKLTQHKKVVNNPVNNPTESVSLDQLCVPWLEDLLQPTHSSL